MGDDPRLPLIRFLRERKSRVPSLLTASFPAGLYVIVPVERKRGLTGLYSAADHLAGEDGYQDIWLLYQDERGME